MAEFERHLDVCTLYISNKNLSVSYVSDPRKLKTCQYCFRRYRTLKHFKTCKLQTKYYCKYCGVLQNDADEFAKHLESCKAFYADWHKRVPGLSTINSESSNLNPTVLTEAHFEMQPIGIENLMEYRQATKNINKNLPPILSSKYL